MNLMIVSVDDHCDVYPPNQRFEVPSISTWAASVQAAVTAIRNAGATKQMILLPGSE
jgi:hypothetical protein